MLNRSKIIAKKKHTSKFLTEDYRDVMRVFRKMKSIAQEDFINADLLEYVQAIYNDAFQKIEKWYGGGFERDIDIQGTEGVVTLSNQGTSIEWSYEDEIEDLIELLLRSRSEPEFRRFLKIYIEDQLKALLEEQNYILKHSTMRQDRREIVENIVLSDLPKNLPEDAQKLFNYVNKREALPYEEVRRRLIKSGLTKSEVNKFLADLVKDDGGRKNTLTTKIINGVTYVGSPTALDNLKEHIRQAARLDPDMDGASARGRADDTVRDALREMTPEEMENLKSNITSMRVAIPRGSLYILRTARRIFGDEADKIALTSEDMWGISGSITFKKDADLPEVIKSRLDKSGKLDNIKAISYLVKKEGMKLS